MKRKKYILPVVCLLIGIVNSGIVWFKEADTRLVINEIARPGEEKSTIHTLTAVYEGREELVEIKVNERSISFMEAQELFEEAREEVIRVMEEKNGPPEEISADLYLPETALEGRVILSWYSTDTGYIFDDGTINIRKCLQLPEEGEIVVMTARMVLQKYEAELTVPVYLCKENIFNKLEEKRDIIDEYLKRSEEDAAEEEVVKLPSEIEGKSVVFYRNKEKHWWKVLVFFAILAAFSVLMQRQRENNSREQRERELQLTYSSIVTKISLLTGAGSSIKGAWERLVKDYKENGHRNGAYEEMLRTYNEMQNGLPESEAYCNFGKRCKLSQYVKFGNLLEQNLRKGTRGLSERLEYEVWEALENRKAIALRMGEEAGTKLLFPMVLLLGIIIAICVIPAFLVI